MHGVHASQGGVRCATEREVYIVGNAQQIEMAKAMIAALVEQVRRKGIYYT